MCVETLDGEPVTLTVKISRAQHPELVALKERAERHLSASTLVFQFRSGI